MLYNSMNKNSNQSRFEMSQKHKDILFAMREFGIVQDGHIPYNEAVKIYYEWINKGIKPQKYELFGEYSFRVEDYVYITKDEFEAMWDMFRSYKPKKLFSGVKMYCRNLYSNPLGGKEKGKFLKDGDILWEVTGLDRNTVMEMARRASEIAGINVVLFDSGSNKVTMQ